MSSLHEVLVCLGGVLGQFQIPGSLFDSLFEVLVEFAQFILVALALGDVLQVPTPRNGLPSAANSRSATWWIQRISAPAMIRCSMSKGIWASRAACHAATTRARSSAWIRSKKTSITALGSRRYAQNTASLVRQVHDVGGDVVGPAADLRDALRTVQVGFAGQDFGAALRQTVAEPADFIEARTIGADHGSYHRRGEHGPLPPAR